MHDDDPLAPDLKASGAKSDAETLAALQAMLESAEGVAPQPTDGPPPTDTFFGLTMGALFAGLVISTVGLGMFRYGKVEAQPLYLLFGVLLFVTPFVFTSTLYLVVAGLVLFALPILLKKFLYW